MKTTIFKNLLAILSFWVVGCESYIEVETPQSQLTTPAVFEDIVTADAAISDIYAHMRELGVVSGTLGSLSVLSSTYADEMQFTAANMEILQFYNHTIVPSNSLITPLWKNTYTEIYATNLILEGVASSTTLTTEQKDRLSGEAYFFKSVPAFLFSKPFWRCSVCNLNKLFC